MDKELILLVDDDAELCSLVGQYLEARGFLVEAAPSGEEGLARVNQGGVTLMVLDVMLPGMDGFAVLKNIRNSASASLPVVMLTAHGDEIDRILGLELGADDYLSKPFNPRELLARIKAVLRRGHEPPAPVQVPPVPQPLGPQHPVPQPPAAGATSPPAHGRENHPPESPVPPHTAPEYPSETASAPSAPAREGDAVAPPEIAPTEQLCAAGLVMDVPARTVRREGERVELTATEFDLLQVLLSHAGSVVRRDELARRGMGRRLLPFDRSLDLHMSKLRRKLGQLPDGGERIRTLRGVGYIVEREWTNG